MGDLRRRCSSCGESYAAGVIFCPRDGSALPVRADDAGPDPYLGRTLLGTFRVDALVGSGAVARVYRAHQLGVERNVALKIMHPDLAANPALTARFRREARIAGALEHPNVVSVISLDEIDQDGLRVPLLVLEYLDGLSLRSALSAQGCLTIPRTLHILLQLADALGAAHQRGIVHRDVKPDNVMLVQRGSDCDFVKLLDFGIARAAADQSAEFAGTATRAGAILGSARYLAPECAAGGASSPASDVYALATLGYECLSGSTPFDADNAVQILIQQQHSAPTPLAERASGQVPPRVARVIDGNLAKAAEARASDAQAFALQLLEAAELDGFGVVGSSRTRRGYAVSELEPRSIAQPVPALALPISHSRAKLRGEATRRALFVLFCFALGAGAALGIAAKLGAFGERGASPRVSPKAGMR